MCVARRSNELGRALAAIAAARHQTIFQAKVTSPSPTSRRGSRAFLVLSRILGMRRQSSNPSKCLVQVKVQARIRLTQQRV